MRRRALAVSSVTAALRSRLATRVLLAAVLIAAVLGPVPPTQAYPRPGRTERVSLDSDGTAGNDRSFAPDITSDGRYIAFASFASNLVPGDTNSKLDVFLYDRETRITERFSVASDGTEGNDISLDAKISGDGRYITFFSLASNLDPGDTNGAGDVFLYDRDTRTTERVSLTPDGGEGDGLSRSPAINPDGRYVTFFSSASNLVPGDTNGAGDVFVHDRQTGTTELVSVASDGAQGNGSSVSPAISADGRYVAFDSLASNLVPGDTNSAEDVFIHDRETGATKRLSVASDGAEGNGHSFFPEISADGESVAFHSWASNLVPGDTNGIRNPFAGPDVFVHDRETGTTERVSVASDGTEGNDRSLIADISADGRYVAFESFASNLIPDDNNTWVDAFVHDRETRATERVTTASDGTAGNFPSGEAAISADGRHVAFVSQASNLVPDDTNAAMDIFVRDRGPATGVGSLEAQRAVDELFLSGWVTFSGIDVASADDPGNEAGAAGRGLGAEITGGSVVYRPEQEDLLMRMDLASVPGHAAPWTCLPPNPCAALATGGGAPGVLYRWSFAAGGATYEVRALRAATTADPPDADAYFALYDCTASCAEATRLSGGIGTTGAEVSVSVPLSAIAVEEGAGVSGIRASTAHGETRTGGLVTLDEVALPDATIPSRRVSIGIAPEGSPAEEIPIETEATLDDGSFVEILDLSTFVPGIYEVRARACLDDTCGSESIAMTLGDATSPGPSSSPTDPPTPEPTVSLPPVVTELSITPGSETSAQYSDEAFFEARLTDADGAAIEGAEVTFDLTGTESSRSLTANTDSEGIASVISTLEEKPGTHQLTVRYEGDESRAGSADTTTFFIEKEDSDLELTVSGNGNKRILTARLADRDAPATGIAGRTIDFYADGELIDSATTDGDGVASLKPPPRYRGGKHDFEARFDGDDYYRASSAHASTG